MRDSLTLTAPAKINLTLKVGARRADGFHEIRSVMQAISLYDTITLTGSGRNSDTLEITGPESAAIDSVGSDNLVLRALRQLRSYKPELPFCHIELEKVIPVGAGLGGGSSDCASVLLGANQLFGLSLSKAELTDIGARLGSDVPFFFSGGSALVSGRGETFEELDIPLDYSLVLVNPGIHISTAVAFAELDNFRAKFPVQAESEKRQNAENTPLTSPKIGYNFSCSSESSPWWRSLEEEGSDFESLFLSGRCKAKSINDFAVALQKIHDRFRKSHATFIRMSGSGSTVFGVFGADVATEIEAKRFESIARKGWRVFVCRPIFLPSISA